MFELKVGDVIQLRGNSWKWKVEAELFTIEGDPVVQLTRGKTLKKMVFKTAAEKFGTVHRPTPDGMVQVWPEVIQ